MGLSSSKFSSRSKAYQPYPQGPPYGNGIFYGPNVGGGFIPGNVQGFIPGYGYPQLQYGSTYGKKHKRKRSQRNEAYPTGFRSSNTMHVENPYGFAIPIPNRSRQEPSGPMSSMRVEPPATSQSYPGWRPEPNLPMPPAAERHPGFPVPQAGQASQERDLHRVRSSNHRRDPPQSQSQAQADPTGIRPGDPRNDLQSRTRSQPQIRFQPQVDEAQQYRRMYEPHQLNNAPLDPQVARILEPLSPAHPSAYGPQGARPQTPLTNPLPPPPRDLYEMSPYKSLLNLPQTTALLTSSYVQRPVQKKEQKKSLRSRFNLFTSRKNEPIEPEVRYIPVFVQSKPQSNGTNSAAAAPSIPTSASVAPAPSGPNPTSPDTVTSSGSEPVRFNQQNIFAGFLNHSPHHVVYEQREYPTATHLYEAIKYLPDHPELAERIRNCPDIADVYPLSASFQKHQRPDWSHVFMNVMEDVLFAKLVQHPDLRNLLMSTGEADLIYNDATDSYWGDGTGQGANELGKALVRVRRRLREEGYLI